MLKPRGGVSDKPVARVIGQLGRLCLDMGAQSAEWLHPGDIKLAQDVIHQDRSGALAIRRMLDQFDAFIRPADRVGIVTARRGKVFERVNAAPGLQRGDHVFRNLAFVKAGSPVHRDAPQNVGLLWCAEHLPGNGRFACK